jgi:hypothetical protein
MSDEYDHNDYLADKLAQLPYDFVPGKVLISKTESTDIYFTAQWHSQSLITPSASGPWHFLRSSNNSEDITPLHWNTYYPGTKHVSITDWTTLQGTYQDKNVRWSKTNFSYIYDNNHLIQFPPPSPQGEESEVSELLESSTYTLQCIQSKITPEHMPSLIPRGLPSTPELPRMSTPVTHATTMKGKAPVTWTQQLTPPISKVTMTSTLSSVKLLGTPPEAFDGTASIVENFLSILQSYYYLNNALFTNKSKRVASALTHFKIGTAAGEWAWDRQNAALTATLITFGT